MATQLNKILILALGIGIIVMLVWDPGGKNEAVEQAPPEPSAERPKPSVPSALPRTAAKTVGAATSDEPDADEPDEPETGDAASSFQEVMGRVMRGEATEEEQIAFWENIQTSKELDGLISTLKETADADPEDVETRLSLAKAYVTKLLGTTAGPAKGLWAAKAQTVWEEVLEVDSGNWEAQHSIAFSYSQYPDFLNKTGEAIKEYEKTIAIQDAASESHGGFAKSYLELAKLHLKNGDPSNALSTLEQGVAKHPDDAALAEQLQTVSSSYKFEEGEAP